MEIEKKVAIKEVEDWINSLGIRPHKLLKLKEHKDDLITMVRFGIVRFENDTVVYVLENEFEDGTSELKLNKKRYTVEEGTAMGSQFEGDNNEKALGVFGCMCSPVQPVEYMLNLKEGFTDLNSIAAFFLPL